MIHPLDGRFCAYEKLQTIQTKHSPGSPRYEQVEHALDLALNDGRTVDNFLIRNLLRDSQRILNRQAANRCYVNISEESYPYPEAGAYGFCVDFLTDYTTPEALLAAEQLAEALVAEVAHLSQHVSRIMEGLISGETLEETASVCGISTARVNQLRRAFRIAAMNYVGGYHA